MFNRHFEISGDASQEEDLDPKKLEDLEDSLDV
jgi:hypothetical protein